MKCTRILTQGELGDAVRFALASRDEFFVRVRPDGAIEEVIPYETTTTVSIDPDGRRKHVETRTWWEE